MRIIHLTAKRFLYTTADNFYIRNLAVNFARELGDDYLLVVGDMEGGDFQGIKTVNLKLRPWVSGGMLYFWSQYVYYIFWLPYFFLKNKIGKETIIFSNDSTLLPAVVFWKKLFGFKYKICSDWHMLYNNWRDKYIAQNSDYLITTSEKLRKFIVSKTKINQNKIKAVYGGVDVGPYQARSISAIRNELGLPEDKKLIAYVGLFKTMGMEKGLRTMIDALEHLPSDHMMAFIGGLDGEIGDYSEYAKSKGFAERCIFGPRQEFEKVVLYEQAMDVLAIPYPDKPHFRDYGFPMKVYEYMAAKCPILYSRLELTEEILSDCGFTFQADNPKDFAKNAYAIFDKNNREEVEKKVELAYNKVVELTWKDKVQNIIEFMR